MSKENNTKDKDKALHIGGVSNCDFFCKETILINGKGKCKNQCNDCSRIENTEYTDTNGHIGSCCQHPSIHKLERPKGLGIDHC